MAQGEIVVGLDIGTTKICTVIGEVTDDLTGNVEIMGVGLAPSRGIRRGVVVDIDQTTTAIIQSVEQAQRMAGVEVHSVIVGVTGEHIASLNSRGVVAITHPDREIRRDDLERVLENARVIVLPPDREIIHVIPRGYSIDGQNGIRSPIGMSGTRLEVETHIVTGATTFLQNVAKCIQRARLHVEETVLEPIATGTAVVMQAERDLGVVLLDIGGGTSDLAIYQNGEVCYSSVIPIGGQYVTKDISAGLRTTMEEAERVKVAFGSAVHIDQHQPLPESDDTVDDDGDTARDVLTFSFTRLGATEPTVLPVSILTEIIEPRMAELFQMMEREIIRSNYSQMLPAGLVLSGGGALLAGTAALATALTDLPARIGYPIGIGGLTDVVADPSFATGVGLVQWGGRAQAGLPRREEEPTGLIAAITGWMRRVFADVLRR